MRQQHSVNIAILCCPGSLESHYSTLFIKLLSLLIMAPSSSSSSSSASSSPPPSHPGTTLEPVLGSQTTSDYPTSMTPTAYDLSPSSTSIQSGTPTLAINRIQQISSHLNLPSTLRYKMSSQEFKQAPHKVNTVTCRTIIPSLIALSAAPRHPRPNRGSR